MEKKLYINFSKNTEVNHERVTIGDIASVWCSDKNVLAQVKSLTVLKVPETVSRRYVVTALKIFEIIEENVKDVDIVNVGIPEFIISYKKPVKKKVFLDVLKVIFIALIVFCGGAFAIMAYGNDIAIDTLFSGIAQWITGSEGNGKLILEIAYSVGLSLGIIVFYNHLGNRRYEKDPTPIEVQMRLYEEDLDTAVINNSVREEHAKDVD